MTRQRDIDLLRDVMLIARELLSSTPPELIPNYARALLDSIHNGKYGDSHSGIWTQARNSLDSLDALMDQIENLKYRREDDTTT